MDKYKISQILLEKGIKPSVHRIEIMDYLLKTKEHPTVDTIYTELIQKVPTLSKTTVYNTVKLLIDKKLVISILTTNGEARFDADVNKHGHIQCVICGKILDFEVSGKLFEDISPKNFKLLDYQINMKGICHHCQITEIQ